jgi:hypothetical protein
MERKVSPRIEWRVNVDQVDSPGEFLKQRWQYILLVAPDQTIAPLRIAPSAEQVEHPLALLGGLVYRLDRLEGQGHP